jgi:hypothetical protein
MGELQNESRKMTRAGRVSDGKMKANTIKEVSEGQEKAA